VDASGLRFLGFILLVLSGSALTSGTMLWLVGWPWWTHLIAITMGTYLTTWAGVLYIERFGP
jgi:membrane protein implicated in regulation of membrane protease activity